MSTTTLATLRTRVLECAKMENSSFVSTTEVNARINTAAGMLYDLIVSAFEGDYITEATFSISSPNSTFDVTTLNPTFYKLVYIDRSDGSGYKQVYRYDSNDRNLKSYTLRTYYSPVRYRLEGKYLKFVPTDSAAGSYRIGYIPEYTQLVNDNDVLTVPNSYAEYVVASVVADLLAEEESDPSYWLAKKIEVEKKIEIGAQRRDATGPIKMKKVETRRYVEDDEW